MPKLLFWLSTGLVVYVYFGYPALVALLSKRRNRPDDSALAAPELPAVTAIIPAYNEERWIARKIENTLRLDYPAELLQILVASDGSTDDTVVIASRYVEQGVRINHQSRRSGKSATLNRALADARGDVVLVTDCTAALPPDALRLLVRHFQDPSVGCVTGPRVCLPTGSSASEGEGLYFRYESWIKSSESKLGFCIGANGQILAVQRELFPHIPDVNDDFYVPTKILISTGKQLRIEPGAKAFIPAAASLGREYKRKIRTHVGLLRNVGYLAEGLNPLKSRAWWSFLSHHILRLAVPCALATALISSTYLWRTAALYRFITDAQGIFYFAAGLGYICARRGLRLRVVYIPFYFVFANLAVLVALFEWVRGGHQPAWQRTERMTPIADHEFPRPV